MPTQQQQHKRASYLTSSVFRRRSLVVTQGIWSRGALSPARPQQSSATAVEPAAHQLAAAATAWMHTYTFQRDRFYMLVACKIRPTSWTKMTTTQAKSMPPLKEARRWHVRAICDYACNAFCELKETITSPAILLLLRLLTCVSSNNPFHNANYQSTWDVCTCLFAFYNFLASMQTVVVESDAFDWWNPASWFVCANLSSSFSCGCKLKAAYWKSSRISPLSLTCAVALLGRHAPMGLLLCVCVFPAKPLYVVISMHKSGQREE